MIRTLILGLFLCSAFQGVVSAEDRLTIFVDKTQFLKLNQAADTISIGNPDMVSLNLKSPKFLILTGLKVGATDIHILNKKGNSTQNELFTRVTHQCINFVAAGTEIITVKVLKSIRVV